MILRFCGVRSDRNWPLCFPLAMLAVFAVAYSARGQISSGLISQTQAHSIGLERAWYARAQVDPAHSKVVRWALSRDQLVLLTNAGLIHVMDANTGQTVWTSDVGNPEYPSLGPAANEDFIALVNGSTLYLLDRRTGQLVNEHRLDGAPGAGPALTKEYVYAPLLSGRIEGYPLHDAKAPPWFYQAYGHAMSPPLATPDSIVWGTDSGYLYVGRITAPGVRFRVETGGDFDAKPAFRAPLIYAASRNGEVLAVDEMTGRVRWRYVTGFPTDRAPAAVGDRVYVSTEQPELHCIDAATGIGQWEASEVAQFAAASKTHVYGINSYGTIMVLDATTGAVSGRLDTGGEITAFVNDQTDRLYLLSQTGLVQCLYEIGAKKPTSYAPAPVEGPEKPKAEGRYRGNAQPAEKPEAAPAPKPAADNGNPFGAPAAAPPKPAAAAPAPAENKPAAPAAAPSDDNPFGS
jgi:outer membrane protein assembly factor BamB